MDRPPTACSTSCVISVTDQPHRGADRMIGVSLRSLLSHKLRLALTTIAVILGVSFVAGTFILTDTINATFTSIFATANAGVAVTVHGRPIAGQSGGIGGGQNHPVPTSLLATVRAVPGVKDAVGRLFREGATLIGHNGKPIGGNGPPTFGANWITDSAHLAVSPAQRHARRRSRLTSWSMRAPRRRTGSRLDSRCRSSSSVASRNTSPSPASRGTAARTTSAGATIALFTESTAERVLDGQNKYDSILVSAQSGVTDVVLREHIAAALPSYAEAETGQQAAAAAEQSTELTRSARSSARRCSSSRSSRCSSAAFLIINTFNILVAQRTRELALLRALGATRAQVMTSVLVEAALTGIGGVDPRLRRRHSHRTRRCCRSSARRRRAASPCCLAPSSSRCSSARSSPSSPRRLPARRATRIAPVAALAEALPETQPLPRRRIAIGLVIFVLGCAALVTGLFTSAGVEAAAHRRRLPGGVPRRRAARPAAGRAGGDGARVAGGAHLAERPGCSPDENARRNPRRTALTAAALMIGLALVTLCRGAHRLGARLHQRCDRRRIPRRLHRVHPGTGLQHAGGAGAAAGPEPCAM